MIFYVIYINSRCKFKKNLEDPSIEGSQEMGIVGKYSSWSTEIRDILAASTQRSRLLGFMIKYQYNTKET